MADTVEQLWKDQTLQEKLYPITKESAVVDDNNVSLDTKIASKLEGVKVNGTALPTVNKTVNVLIPVTSVTMSGGYAVLTLSDGTTMNVPVLNGSTIKPNNLPDATSSIKGAVVVDSTLSDSSTNPVQNKAVKEAIDNLDTGVSDVKIATTSIVSDGIAIIPKASRNNEGVVKITPQYVIWYTSSYIDLTFADVTILFVLVFINGNLTVPSANVKSI